MHRWIFRASLAALRRGVPGDEAEVAILAAMTRPPNARDEVRDALRKAGASAFSGPSIQRARWPKPASRTTGEHYAGLGRQRGVLELVDVWEQSPVRLLDEAPVTEAVIARLFRPDELVCCGRGVERAETRPAREFGGRLNEFTHLVPSPMSAVTGLTQEGCESCRCLANTGARKFLVIEFDREPSLDRQAQMLVGLATHGQLVLVIFSGKKSLHGWFHVEGWQEGETHKLYRLAVACGADAATWTRCQRKNAGRYPPRDRAAAKCIVLESSVSGGRTVNAPIPEVDSDGELRLEPFRDAYYDANHRTYLMRNAGHRWLSFPEQQFKKRLRAAGFRGRTVEGELISPADQAMLWLQDHHDVNYAAPLAGRASGFYEQNGARYLVTDSPLFIEPIRGEWPVLRAVLDNLFVRNEPTHGSRQWHTFLTWLKHSVEALRAGKAKEAQALAIAGPPQSGKSLLQRLLTPLLGGRECKPFLFMTGRTSFNAELFEAEHLMLEDEHMSRRLADRLALAAAIKGIVANQSHLCHRKNCTGITLRPFWRLTITLNDEPEALLVLPPLDDHVADKLLLLRASCFPLPMRTVTYDERHVFFETLISELPAFLHFLIREYEPPALLCDARYVVVGWHHPDLAEALHGLSPAAALLGLIDQLEPWERAATEWKGTAEELRSLLFSDARTVPDARRLLEWSQACGNYLATLAKKNPERVRAHRTPKARLWIIKRA